MAIIEVTVNEDDFETFTRSVYQHDTNVILMFNGIELPEEYEVYFSNEKQRGISVATKGNSGGVKIPDALLSTGDYVYAWLKRVDSESGIKTIFTVTIPVIPNPVPVYAVEYSSNVAKTELEVLVENVDRDISTKSVFQHDKNVTLTFKGIELPEEYIVQFSNDKKRGTAVQCKGESDTINVPDALLSTGEYVYAWVEKEDDEEEFKTIFTVTIPVIPRPVPIPVSQISYPDTPIIKYEVDENEENLSFLNGLEDTNN